MGVGTVEPFCTPANKCASSFIKEGFLLHPQTRPHSCRKPAQCLQQPSTHTLFCCCFFFRCATQRGLKWQNTCTPSWSKSRPQPKVRSSKYQKEQVHFEDNEVGGFDWDGTLRLSSALHPESVSKQEAMMDHLWQRGLVHTSSSDWAAPPRQDAFF